MEDPFNGTTFSFRTDRLGRMRDLITQIKADQECCRKLLLKLDTGRGDQSDIEELQRTTAWLHRNLAIYKKIQSSSIEGVVCGEGCLVENHSSIRDNISSLPQNYIS